MKWIKKILAFLKTLLFGKKEPKPKTVNDVIKDCVKEIFLRKPTKEDLQQIIITNISSGIEIRTRQSPYKLATIKKIKSGALSTTICRCLLLNKDKTYSVVSTIPDRARIKKVGS